MKLNEPGKTKMKKTELPTTRETYKSKCGPTSDGINTESTKFQICDYFRRNQHRINEISDM